MTKVVRKPKIFGTGLIALDLIIGVDPESPVRSSAGGTCGNILSILAYLGWDAFPIARMNGDSASQRVRADMKHWGVKLDFTACSPTTHTPIIVQEIRRGRDGAPKHSFSWSCPRCGQWLPAFKAVTRHAVDTVAPNLRGAAVFFMDRLSRSALTLAARASEEGAAVLFEPSGKSDQRLFEEAFQLAHIVKYSDERLSAAGGAMRTGSPTLLEVQTLGSKGLRYRHRLRHGVSNWLHLGAIAAPHLADTCGAGDWCTAGLVAKAVAGGQAGLRTGGPESVRRALRYGQALAAWNCGFEGARGGMYAVSREVLNSQVDRLLKGRPCIPLGEIKSPPNTSVACPACSPDTPRVIRSKTSTPRRNWTSASAA